MRNKLAGKVVVITGAGSGIGKALAEEFRQSGCRLVLNSLKSEFADVAGDDAIRLAGDINDAGVRQELVNAAVENFGGIDILVNNAGIGLYDGAINTTAEEVRAIFATNCFSVLGLIQQAQPHLKRGSVVVNIGSVGAVAALPWATVYCASKFALHGITEGLRRELRGEGIKVVLAVPGIVDTNFRNAVIRGKAPGAVLDINKTISPERAARDIIRGIMRGREVIYTPRLAWAYAQFGRLAPWLMEIYIRSKNK